MHESEKRIKFVQDKRKKVCKREGVVTMGRNSGGGAGSKRVRWSRRVSEERRDER